MDFFEYAQEVPTAGWKVECREAGKATVARTSVGERVYVEFIFPRLDSDRNDGDARQAGGPG